MSSDTLPTSTPRRLSLELALVVGLPLASVALGLMLVFVAYVHGFTEIPQSEYHAMHHG